MKKLICAVMILALLLIAFPAQADRLEELQEQFIQAQQKKQGLLQEIAQIDTIIARLQGAFAERQMMEQPIEQAIEQPVVEVIDPKTIGQ